MPKFEVAYVRQETIYTSYYITVEAESVEAASEKVMEYDVTEEESATIVEGKCLGIDDSHLERVVGVRELKEKGNA